MEQTFSVKQVKGKDLKETDVIWWDEEWMPIRKIKKYDSVVNDTIIETESMHNKRTFGCMRNEKTFLVKVTPEYESAKEFFEQFLINIGNPKEKVTSSDLSVHKYDYDLVIKALTEFASYRPKIDKTMSFEEFCNENNIVLIGTPLSSLKKCREIKIEAEQMYKGYLIGIKNRPKVDRHETHSPIIDERFIKMFQAITQMLAYKDFWSAEQFDTKTPKENIPIVKEILAELQDKLEQSIKGITEQELIDNSIFSPNGKMREELEKYLTWFMQIRIHISGNYTNKDVQEALDITTHAINSIDLGKSASTEAEKTGVEKEKDSKIVEIEMETNGMSYKCPNCPDKDHIISIGEKFCPNCGSKINWK